VRDELRSRGREHDVDLAVVTFGATGRGHDYREHLGIDCPILDDAERGAYREYGLGRGSLRSIYRGATLRRYAQLLRQGRRLKRPTADTRQLGGDFVIGVDGRLRFVHRPVAPDDRPTASSIVDALEPPAGGHAAC
jgi:hypothetical protein